MRARVGPRASRRSTRTRRTPARSTNPLARRRSALAGRPDRASSTPSSTRRAGAETRPTSSSSRTQLRAIGAGQNLQVEFTGEAEGPPPETPAPASILGLIAAFFVLLILFRALVPTLIPLLFAIVAVVTAFLLLYLGARFTNFNTIVEILVPMIGLGVGIDYTLFIVTRFRQLLHDGLTPQEAAAAAGATAGRAVIFAGPTVADLDHRPGADRDRLHHEARHRQRPRRAHRGAAWRTRCCPAVLSLLGHKIDRWPARPEADRRLPRGPVPHLGRAPGAGSSSQREASLFLTVLVVLLILASPVLAGAARPGRLRHGAEAADRPARPTTCSRRASGPASPRRSRSSSTCAATTRRRRSWRTPSRACRASPGSCRRSTTPRRRDAASVAIINVYSKYEPQDAKTDDIVSTAARRRDPEDARRLDGQGLRVGPERGLHGHRRQDPEQHAVVPAVRHRRHLRAAGDGVPLAGDRGQGRAHDAARRRWSASASSS